mmetsp:Transcript_102788/g.319682  ORF Transcript_102788/g.319682 Transcript_102788/m.319682 type:complete len:466 (-) Transcript_102788:2-1399(-)
MGLHLHAALVRKGEGHDSRVAAAEVPLWGLPDLLRQQDVLVAEAEDVALLREEQVAHGAGPVAQDLRQQAAAARGQRGHGHRRAHAPHGPRRLAGAGHLKDELRPHQRRAPRLVARVRAEDNEEALAGARGGHGGRLHRQLRVRLPGRRPATAQDVQPPVGQAHRGAAEAREAPAKGAWCRLLPGLEAPAGAVHGAGQGLAGRGEGLEVDPPRVRQGAGVDDAAARDAVLRGAGERHALDRHAVWVEHPHDLVVVEAAVPHKNPELPPRGSHGVRALLRRGLEAKVLVVHTARLVFAEGPWHAAAADLLVAVRAARVYATPRVRLPHPIRDTAWSTAVAKQRWLVGTSDHPVHGPAAMAPRRHALPAVHEAVLALGAQLADAAGHLVLVLETLGEEAEDAVGWRRGLCNRSKPAPCTTANTRGKLNTAAPARVPGLLRHHAALAARAGGRWSRAGGLLLLCALQP